MRHTAHAKQRGSILVTILMITFFLTSVLFGLLLLANANLYRARGRIMMLQAQYSAESGADAAIAVLNSGNTSFAGDATEVTVLNGTQYRSTYTSTVQPGADEKERVVVATGRVYSPKTSTTPRYTRTIRVSAQRTSTSFASSIVSRNIVDVASGVKRLTAKDIYANGYIYLNKNTTELVAENIAVAGKNTSASNCSVGGAGVLLKPLTFSNPAQNKTNITLAFNNCITPPGNTPNADFNVMSNQTNVSPIQSTYIPWTQYMDSSYQSAPGGCNDWTSGASPRSIPSVGNTKKTHYPNSGSNTINTCGVNGSLNLGSDTYIIRDHVHLRANLCSSTSCMPTFTNPDAAIKYVFVEGTLSFNAVKTTAGSGPIVFITYGADPASKAGSCPHGGSLYLGQSGSSDTNAPMIYFMAMNGLCIDKTKFDASPALGGISGKNIYVASNPGTPRDLALDPSFPVNLIPDDLGLRQVDHECV